MPASSSALLSIVRLSAVVAGLLVLMSGPAVAADDLADMSLEDLMNITVTSASKREQNKVDAAAAITVLTNEDIRRSGATSIPEALRMVPGLNVARIDSSRWAISSRGYNGQFANKMLVLIDGRVVYSPLFGGVQWDVQDVVLEDIDRIEVIRGSGGTLWGANAVNGVINITTKSARETKGALISGVAGNQEYGATARYGGMIGDHTGVRVYGKGFKRKEFTMPSTATYEPHDAWWQWRTGLRADSQLGENDHVTLQGDFYDGQLEATTYNLGTGAVTPLEDSRALGGNVLTRWNHTLTESQSLEVQAYWDYTRRDGEETSETRNSVDVQAQHDFTLGQSRQWLFNWGAEYFFTGDKVTTGTGGTSFNPSAQDFHRASGFVQAQWNLFDERLQLIAGTKLEYNNYTDFEYQPTGKVLWKMFEGNSVWASASRAVRAPTRVDRDISFGGLVNGNKDIQSEDLIAIEGGYRNFILPNVTLDVTAFLNLYDDLAALEGTTFVNGSKSKARGVETEIAWAPVDDLRFVTSYAFLVIDDEFSTGAVAIFGGNDGASPRHTWMLRALWNLPVVPVELDSAVWYVSALDGRIDPAGPLPPTAASGTVGDYWRLDVRMSWQALDWLALEVAGQNLTDKSHLEWGVGPIPLFPGTYVPRSYNGKVTLTF